MRLHLSTKPDFLRVYSAAREHSRVEPADKRNGVCQTAVMAVNKTQATGASVEEFLEGVENPARQRDGLRLLALMKKNTGEVPVMWGPSIVGFGSYHYRYESGREGDTVAVGFSPRKGSISLYGLTYAPEAAELLPRLGKHKVGAGCLYINKLADVDEAVLAELIRAGHRHSTTVMHQK